MSIEEFVLKNFGDLSGWGAFALMVLLHLRNNRADNKDNADVTKAQIQLSERLVESREKSIEVTERNAQAVEENTKAILESNAADLAAHKTTHDSLTGVDRNVLNLISSLSHLEASFTVTVDEFREKHKEQAKELAAIGLQVSDVKNALTELVQQRHPNPADTQEITEAHHAEARELSGGATTLVEGVILTLEAESTKEEDGGEKAA